MSRVRIVTNRKFAEEGAYEAIEIDERGTMYWLAVQNDMEACLPCGVEDVAKVFERAGRVFDPSRLPAHANLNPYA